MEQRKKYRALFTIIFLISAAGLAYAIKIHWSWLTLLLPFVALSFVKALDIM